MARTSRPVHVEPRPANLPLQAIPEAVRKLERRRDEFRGADPTKHAGELWHLAESLSNKLSATLLEVFGPNTIELQRATTHAHDFVTMSIGGETPRYRQLEAFNEGREQAIARMDTEISILKERLGDNPETSSARALRAYEGLELHPAIVDAAGDLFRDGHYANAIEDAVKALNNLVRLKSGLELDGTSLMERAFSPATPVLQFNDMADESDRNEQKGFMMMFSGAVAGLRNPRAHKLIKDDAERALEFIAFVSLLAKLLDNSKRPSRKG